jgi:hypothetical protein
MRHFKDILPRIPGLVLIVPLLMVIGGCELFYPDSIVETPELVQNEDSLNFAGILDSTRERFTKLNYEDLFNERFTYHASDNQIFNRRQLLDRLDVIERSYDQIQVLWDTTAASNEPDIFNKQDTVALYRKYHLITFSSTAKQQKDYYGRSRFDLMYHPFKNSWCILRWYDEKDEPGLTFFHPEFRE